MKRLLFAAIAGIAMLGMATPSQAQIGDILGSTPCCGKVCNGTTSTRCGDLVATGIGKMLSGCAGADDPLPPSCVGGQLLKASASALLDGCACVLGSCFGPISQQFAPFPDAQTCTDEAVRACGEADNVVVTPNDSDCGPAQCDPACTGGKNCVSGSCVCPTGQTDCNGTCVNTSNDPNHCGNCTTVCTSGQVCSGGTCTGGCPAGQTDCSGSCVDTQTDNNNCGTCGTACTGGTTCQSGSCACPAGQTDCSGTCVDTQTDNNNCGTCGTACTGGSTCQSGACTCPAGQTNCGGTCVDTQTDNSNCGTCGTICAADQNCVGGACVSPPPTCSAAEEPCPNGKGDCCAGLQCVDNSATDHRKVCRHGSP